MTGNRINRITGNCEECSGSASSEFLTLARRFKLCAHCALLWWRDWLGRGSA